MLLRAESSTDHSAIAQLNRLAFGGDAEARLVEALRADGQIIASVAAEVEGAIVGHILFSRLSIVAARGSIPAAGLAPMAVLPEFQRQGIGSRLIRDGLERCRALGERIVLVLGHPDYYPRFGFSAERAAALDCPFGRGPAWMALELEEGALSGIRGKVLYPQAFQIFG